MFDLPLKREELPERRRSIQWKVEHNGMHFFLTFGYYDDGRIGEVFAAGNKQGSEMQHLIDDSCIMISIMLQHGLPATVVERSMGTVPCGFDGKDERPASVLGTILAAVRAAGWLEDAVA